jgi:HSP20 family protein
MDAIIESADPGDRNTAAATASWYDPHVAFARWDPVRDLLAIQQRLERYAPSQAGWRPSVDLQETDERYVLTAELPGVRQDDLHVSFNSGVLTISGVRREREREFPCEEFHRVERGYGTFSRSFHLPLPVNTEAMTADLRDGVLTVACPKHQDGAAYRISIT